LRKNQPLIPIIRPENRRSVSTKEYILYTDILSRERKRFHAISSKVIESFLKPFHGTSSNGDKKCMDFLFSGYAAGRLKNGLLKRIQAF